MSKQRLIENFNITSGAYKKSNTLNESNETITVSEATSTTPSVYKALAVYTFPISRPDKRNLNNRIYSSALWENVIKSGKAEGTYGLMDHPKEEGSTKDIWCVWRNLRFSEDKKLILCDAYLFGMWGKQVLEALEAGGQIGLSSSGWGEFLGDNTTLDPNSYEIERVADFVFNPSYEVYGVQDDLVTQTESVISEEKEDKKESALNKQEETVMNKIDTSSLEGKALEFNVRSMLKENSKIEDVVRRIEENTNLALYIPEGTLKEEVSNAISNDRSLILEGYRNYESLKKTEEEKEAKIAELTESVANLEKQLEEVKESASKDKSSLEEEFENACTLLDSMKEYTEKQDELLRVANAEKNSLVSVSDYKEALVYAEEKEEENAELKKEINALRRKLKESASKKKEEEPEVDTKDAPEDDKKEEPEVTETPKDDETPEEKDTNKEESYSFYKGVNPDVRNYYEDLEYRNPRMVKIKEEILSKRTLLEAQKTYFKLRSLVEDNGDSYKLYNSGKKVYSESKKKSTSLREGWV